MWPFWFGLLFLHDPSSIKAALLLYYIPVLISTKITIIFSLWGPYWTQPRGLTKLKDQDYLWVQPIGWSLVLPSGWNHRTFASPPEAPATQFCIRFPCGSVLNRVEDTGLRRNSPNHHGTPRVKKTIDTKMPEMICEYHTGSHMSEQPSQYKWW